MERDTFGSGDHCGSKHVARQLNIAASRARSNEYNLRTSEGAWAAALGTFTCIAIGAARARGLQAPTDINTCDESGMEY